MSKPEDFGSFIKENKELFKEYLETRTEVYRLQGIKKFSKAGGTLIWAILSIFLFFLILFFAGLVLGFWLSARLNSNVFGFGLTTLILIVFTLILAFFRKQLFITPIIKSLINEAMEEEINDQTKSN